MAGMTIGELAERFEAFKLLVGEIDKRYNAEFVKISTTSQMMVEQQALALTATKDAVSIAMAAAEKAVEKAELTAINRDTENTRALDAALIAAKEAVKVQQDFNDRAIQKQEAVFTKQIDQIGTQISTLTKSFDDKIDDVKNRVIAFESGRTGGKDTWAWVAVIAGITLATLFVIFKGGT